MIPSHCQDVFWGGKEFTEFSWHQEWKSSPWENRESAWVSGCFCQMCSGVRVPSASSGTGWGFGYPVSVATDHNLGGFTAEGMPYFFHKENQFFSSTESSIGVWLRNVSYSEPGQLCLCARARVHVCLCCGKIIHNLDFSILTVFQCTVQWHWIHSQYRATITTAFPHPRLTLWTH